MIPGAGSRRLHVLAVGAAVLLAASGASAQSGAGAAAALRGPQQPSSPLPNAQDPAALPPAQSGAPPAASPAPASAALAPADEVAPRFTMDPAPRVTGLSAAPAGGAQCRLSCAEDRYLCRSTDLAEACDTTWGQCVAACPEASPDAL